MPLEPFTEGESYREVFEQVLPPALRHFRPDVLVVQAGADAHFDDPLADLMLTTRDYEALFRQILEWAELFTSGRVLFTLGGGYSFGAAPRVWTILYLLLHDLPIESGVPKPWRERWQGAVGETLPESLHDPLTARPDDPEPLRGFAPQPAGGRAAARPRPSVLGLKFRRRSQGFGETGSPAALSRG